MTRGWKPKHPKVPEAFEISQSPEDSTRSNQ